MKNKELVRLTIGIKPELLEAVTQECRRLEIPRATLIKLLCKEFLRDAEGTLDRLTKNKILKTEE